MLGIFNKNDRIGLNFSHLSVKRKLFFGFSNILELRILNHDFLNIFSQFLWKSNQKIESFQFDISQIGNTMSPGIIISRNDKKILQCEGYLSLRF